jgi:catechol 2,3-dioxygenase-like lactoylglutathione lyase family enzyme
VITGLDHVSLACADPVGAAAAYAVLLGQPADAHGRFQLDNTALQILPGAGEGEFGLGFAADDLAGTRRMLERRGIGAEGPRMALNAAHGVPASLNSPQPVPTRPNGRPDAPHAIDHVVVFTPNPERAVALYGGRLGLDLRLDRANPQWGTRLMFFRCGGVVIEVSADLKAPVSDGPDRITGLAWRVADADGARARLAAAGLDVSEVRTGRKPGTRVFTLRAGVPGAPALLLSGDTR